MKSAIACLPFFVFIGAAVMGGMLLFLSPLGSAMEYIALSLLMVSLGAGIFLFVLYIIDRCSNNIFFCEAYGWHKEPKEISSDAVNSKGVCPRCGKKVMLDSQGNWF